LFFLHCSFFPLQALQKAGQIISEIRETHVWWETTTTPTTVFDECYHRFTCLLINRLHNINHVCLCRFLPLVVRLFSSTNFFFVKEINSEDISPVITFGHFFAINLIWKKNNSSPNLNKKNLQCHATKSFILLCCIFVDKIV